MSDTREIGLAQVRNSSLHSHNHFQKYFWCLNNCFSENEKLMLRLCSQAALMSANFFARFTPTTQMWMCEANEKIFHFDNVANDNTTRHPSCFFFFSSFCSYSFAFFPYQHTHSSEHVLSWHFGNIFRRLFVFPHTHTHTPGSCYNLLSCCCTSFM